MLLITSARLGKMFGCRPVYLTGSGVFTVASLVSGIVASALCLIAIAACSVTLSLSGVVAQTLGGALVSANVFGRS